MKTLIWSVMAIALSGSIWAKETPLATYEWDKLAAEGKLLSGTILIEAGRPVLSLANTNPSPITFPLLKIEGPAIHEMFYALTGEVRYEGVKRDGYLEMWNHFPPASAETPGKRFFSRTMGNIGPMQKISRDSEWRRFVLPFDRTGANGSPTRLEFNLTLPAEGKVSLKNVRLAEFSEGVEEALRPAGAWFSEQTAGWIGGIGGSILGCVVPLLGWLSRKGKCRAFVMGALVSLIILGAISSVLGITALVLKQPYGVWFVFLLLGILLITILPSQLLIIRRNFDELGLRKMAAMD